MEAVRAKMAETDGHGSALAEVDRRIHDLQRALEHDGYTFDRRFLFRVLSMGHSQFAELIGARGPNTQINAACASTTQAVGLAEDWIRAGRCQRVVVVAADDVTSDRLLGWMGAGFLASGAAATDEDVEDCRGAVRPPAPRDDPRHGRGGASSSRAPTRRASAASGRSARCSVRSRANSAFHGTRLDVEHIGDVMESVVAQAEARGARREEMAPATVFISHETYTPARGGSAAAEVNALAPRLRRGGRSDRRRQHQGVHRPPDGRRHRGRRRRQGAGDGHRPAGAQLQGARPRPRPAQPVHRRGVSRCATRFGWPPGSAPRSA